MSAADNETHIRMLAKQKGATIPKGGGVYWLQNLKSSKFVKLEGPSADDGARLILWEKNIGTDEQFRYSKYYSGKDETVFTIENVSTLESQGQTGGYGGYVRVDPASNELVQGGAPAPWKLIQTVPGIYQITPFNDIFSKNGSLVLADPQPEISTGMVRIELRPKKDIGEAPFEQYWIFVQLSNDSSDDRSTKQVPVWKRPSYCALGLCVAIGLAAIGAYYLSN